MKALVLLSIILLATFGAGTVDVLFPDVIPLRPYTGIFQAAHSLSEELRQTGLAQLTPTILIAALVVCILTLAIIWLPHLTSSLAILPLGSRGSHSRANRRASGAGWKDTSQKQILTAEEQFRVLMQIFGRPKMVIIYDKQKPEPVSDNRNHR